MSRAGASEDDEDDFDAAFARTVGTITPEKEALERGKRERAMRSPHTVKHHPAHKGDRVQFNRKMRRALRDQVAAACKRHRINETDALEEAFKLWLAHVGKRGNA